MYISDLDVGVDISGGKTIDCKKMGRTVSSDDDSRKVQETRNKVWLWSIKWLMNFIVNKCIFLNLGKDNRKTRYHLDVEI